MSEDEEVRRFREENREMVERILAEERAKEKAEAEAAAAEERARREEIAAKREQIERLRREIEDLAAAG